MKNDNQLFELITSSNELIPEESSVLKTKTNLIRRLKSKGIRSRIKSRLLVIVGIVILIVALVICLTYFKGNFKNPHSGDSPTTLDKGIHDPGAKVAKNYLEEKGYTVTSYEGPITPYVLSKKLLVEFPIRQVWGVQPFSPDAYIGKTIHEYRFIIKGHVLDNYVSGGVVGLGKTFVIVIVVDGKAIGGASAPYTNEKLVGGYYPLDGIQKGEIFENYKKWVEEWYKKYGN